VLYIEIPPQSGTPPGLGLARPGIIRAPRCDELLKLAGGTNPPPGAQALALL